MKTAVKKYLKFFLVSGLFVLGMNQAGVSVAADTLSAVQLRSLIVGKTATLFNLARGFDVEVFFSPDGTLAGENITVNKKLKGSWEITGDGLLCTVSNVATKTCGSFVANGDGTYKRMVDGAHEQTYKAFADGNPKGY